ncbi:MAG: hypothetical protein JNM18_19075 [Planctomycetaceae bacterium]|nr:hypothetical protein [Planctomycetaceae bacterium]
MTRIWLVVIELTWLVGLAGCGASQASNTVRPDVLRIAYTEEAESLNPITSGDLTSGLFQDCVYESLALRNMHDPDELLPCLAEKWEFDEERLEYTIHLRRGVMWQAIKLPNGVELPPRELTMRDVKFTFDCILNPHIPASRRGDFEDLQATDASQRYKIKLDVIDSHTCKIRWNQRYFLAEESILMGPIIPRHVFSVDADGELISLDFSSKEFADGFNVHWANRTMCGTGPLRVEHWRRNERLSLARNADYWGEPFHFKRLVFVCEPNSFSLLQKLLHQELDWADIDQKDLYLQNRHHPEVEAGRVVLKEYNYPGYRYLGYNLRRPLLHDKLVRRALTQAIPVEQIIQVVFNGLATQVTGPFANQSKAYDQSIEPLPFDLAAARKLLDQAGWVDSNHNGTRDKIVDGGRVEAVLNLTIEANSSQYLSVAQIIQTNWRQIGVRVDITPVQQALMTQRMRAKDFDAVLLGWSLAWHADPYNTWYSGNAALPDTSNTIGYSNPEVDKLVTELRVTFDKKKQREIYHRVHRLIYDDQPYTFLFSEKQTCGYHGRLQDVHLYAVAPCVDYREWSARPGR